MAILKEITTVSGTVSISYPYDGDIKEIEVNFAELERKGIVKVGCKCPNLHTQAVSAIRGIERHKDRMLNTVTQLFTVGDEVIFKQLDSIYNYLAVEREAMGDRGDLTQKDFTRIMNDVFCSIEVVKALLELYLSKEYIKDNARELEYARQGVLI